MLKHKHSFIKLNVKRSCTNHVFYFVIHRQLYSQQRIKIHLNLFASFVLTGLVLLIWDIVVHLDRLEKSKEQTLMHKNTVSSSGAGALNSVLNEI